MMTQEKIARFQHFIDGAKSIVFFGGAGVSTESGLPDFRGADGLYRDEKYSPEEMLSIDFFRRYPDDFFHFYKTKLIYPDARPNPTHLKLRELELAGKQIAIVTQNIDGLHQKAGSQTVIELHGGTGFYCLNCRQTYTQDFYLQHTKTPHCLICSGLVRPDIVMYGEMLDQDRLEKAVSLIRLADLLIIGGTSLVVYPAASLVDYFQGRYLVILNKQETIKDRQADLVFREPIGEVFAQIKV